MMIDLDELKRLAGLVTPGEWAICQKQIEANAALIVTLRNALPELIAALEVVELVRDEEWLRERIEYAPWPPGESLSVSTARAIIAALPKETDNG